MNRVVAAAGRIAVRLCAAVLAATAVVGVVGLASDWVLFFEIVGLAGFAGAVGGWAFSWPWQTRR